MFQRSQILDFVLRKGYPLPLRIVGSQYLQGTWLEDEPWLCGWKGAICIICRLDAEE